MSKHLAYEFKIDEWKVKKEIEYFVDKYDVGHYISYKDPDDLPVDIDDITVEVDSYTVYYKGEPI